jgi:hypothetical protein
LILEETVDATMSAAWAAIRSTRSPEPAYEQQQNEDVCGRDLASE